MQNGGYEVQNGVSFSHSEGLTPKLDLYLEPLKAHNFPVIQHVAALHNDPTK